MKLEVDDREFKRFSENFLRAFSPATLEQRTLAIAQEAGVLLHQASVRAVIEAVYDHPNYPSSWTSTPSNVDGSYFTRDGKVYRIGNDSNEATRTNALLDAHQLVDLGFEQLVQIDPSAEAEVDVHPGRELVLDYAIPVHEGYTQWVHGYNTGIFHPGRFWFDVVVQEGGPVISSFILVAFAQMVEKLLEAA